jgi:hypothetical protein
MERYDDNKPVDRFLCMYALYACLICLLYIYIYAGVCMERYDDNKPVDGFLYMYALYVCLICLLYIYIYICRGVHGTVR